MSIQKTIPEELDFFEKEFGLSEEHDPDEGVFSYIKQYEGGRELIFTFEPPGYTVNAKVIISGELVAYLYKENISIIEFQSWNGEQTIRAYSKDSLDFRIHHDPIARIYYGEE